MGDGFADRIRGAFRRGDEAGVLELAQAELARADGTPAGRVEAWYALARLALRADDLRLAEERAGAALQIATAAGERGLEERPRHVLAAVARMSGDFPLARERYLASITLNRELGRADQVDSESYNLALVELRLGGLDRARELLAGLRDRAWLAPYLAIGDAALASAEGDHDRAVRLADAPDRAFAAVGQVPDPDDAAELARVRQAALS